MKYIILLVLSLLITFVNLDGLVVCHSKLLGGTTITTSISQTFDGKEMYAFSIDADIPYICILSIFTVAIFITSYLSLYVIYTFLIRPTILKLRG